MERLDKLVGVPWQPVPSDPDATAVPTVISAETIAEGDDLPDRADPIHGAARRTYLVKNIELRRHGYTGGCTGCNAARLNTAAKPHTAASCALVEEAMTGDEIGRARLAETLLRRDKRREPDDPEIESVGVRRRIEKGASSSSGHRASDPESVPMAMVIDVPSVVDVAADMDIEALLEKQVGELGMLMNALGKVHCAGTTF